MMDEETPRNVWVTKYTSQIILAINMIRWTAAAELAFQKKKVDPNSMKEYAERCQYELKGIVELVRTDLNELDRLTLTSLIVLDVHNRDIITEIVTKNIET